MTSKSSSIHSLLDPWKAFGGLNSFKLKPQLPTTSPISYALKPFHHGPQTSTDNLPRSNVSCFSTNPTNPTLTDSYPIRNDWNEIVSIGKPTKKIHFRIMPLTVMFSKSYSTREQNTTTNFPTCAPSSVINFKINTPCMTEISTAKPNTSSCRLEKSTHYNTNSTSNNGIINKIDAIIHQENETLLQEQEEVVNQEIINGAVCDAYKSNNIKYDFCHNMISLGMYYKKIESKIQLDHH